MKEGLLGVGRNFSFSSRMDDATERASLKKKRSVNVLYITTNAALRKLLG